MSGASNPARTAGSSIASASAAPASRSRTVELTAKSLLVFSIPIFYRPLPLSISQITRWVTSLVTNIVGRILDNYGPISDHCHIAPRHGVLTATSPPHCKDREDARPSEETSSEGKLLCRQRSSAVTPAHESRKPTRESPAIKTPERLTEQGHRWEPKH